MALKIPIIGKEKNSKPSETIQEILQTKYGQLKEYDSNLQVQIGKNNVYEASDTIEGMKSTIIYIENCLKKGGKFKKDELKAYNLIKEQLEDKKEKVYTGAMTRLLNAGNAALEAGMEAALKGDKEEAKKYKEIAKKQYGNIRLFASKYGIKQLNGDFAEYDTKTKKAIHIGTVADDKYTLNDIDGKLNEALAYLMKTEGKYADNLAMAKDLLKTNSMLFDRIGKGMAEEITGEEKKGITNKINSLDKYISDIESNNTKGLDKDYKEIEQFFQIKRITKNNPVNQRNAPIGQGKKAAKR